jgi:DNA polymerase III subunit epsilon
MPRREAADLAATAGCEVAASVTKTTTLLIVGDQDIRKLAGHEKSSKYRKAERLIEKGQSIRILRETDFRSMASFAE